MKITKNEQIQKVKNLLEKDGKKVSWEKAIEVNNNLEELAELLVKIAIENKQRKDNINKLDINV